MRLDSEAKVGAVPLLNCEWGHRARPLPLQRAVTVRLRDGGVRDRRRALAARGAAGELRLLDLPEPAPEDEMDETTIPDERLGSPSAG